MFSDIVDDFIGEPNFLARLKEEVVASGRSYVDLVCGNIQDIGLFFPDNFLREVWSDVLEETRHYLPDSRGRSSARQAISRYYDAQFDPKDIFVVPGTSVAYGYLFSLFCNPGDAVAVPAPSYPLCEYIARLARVTLVPYQLVLRGHRWEIDKTSMEQACKHPRMRAIVAISPHNPTGHVLSLSEVNLLDELSHRYRLPVIVDEVFSPYVFDSAFQKGLPHRFAWKRAPLVCVLNGFSKMLALPGAKFGWIALRGEAHEVRRAGEALETICDTFLATNEWVQAMAPRIFAQGTRIFQSFHDDIERRYCAFSGVFSHDIQGGYYGIRFLKEGSGNDDEETMVARLLREQGVLVHPGYFYACDRAAVVFSFLRLTSSIARGLEM